jgi:hypothetical protein
MFCNICSTVVYVFGDPSSWGVSANSFFLLISHVQRPTTSLYYTGFPIQHLMLRLCFLRTSKNSAMIRSSCFKFQNIQVISMVNCFEPLRPNPVMKRRPFVPFQLPATTPYFGSCISRRPAYGRPLHVAMTKGREHAVYMDTKTRVCSAQPTYFLCWRLLTTGWGPALIGPPLVVAWNEKEILTHSPYL